MRLHTPMKKILRSLVFFILTVVFTVQAPENVVRAAENPIRLVINGYEISGLPMPPTIYQNCVLVPAREVFETLGATVEWIAEKKQALVRYKSNLLVMTIDQKTAELNGQIVEMYIPPLIINGKTMIPLRFPSECFGFEVSWVERERTAYIYIPPEDTAETTPTDDIPLETTPVETIPSETNPSETTPTYGNPSTGTSGGTEGLARDISQSEIPVIQYPETTVNALLTPRETRSSAYTITASSAITEVRKFLLADNRLVIDIYNATCGVTGPFYTDTSVPVSDVRTSQFSNDPKIVRMVFDLTGAAEYSISISDDRKALTVSFAQNIITDVRFSTNGVSDTITITGTSTPVAQIYPLTDPNRFAVNITNAVMAVPVTEAVSGAYITQWSSWQREDGVSCVEAQVRSISSFEVEYTNNTVIIRIYPTTYQNILYDRANHVVSIPKSSGLRFDVNAVQHLDNYNNLQYTLTLPVDAESALGYGEYFIGDGYLQSIKIARDTTGCTQLIFNEARVLGFTVRENDDYYLVKACLPRELYQRVVVIDAGHGGSDPGSLGNGLSEKDINLSIALKLISIFDTDPTIKAYATRLTDVTFVREQRPIYANGIGDLFVSIHCNAAKTGTEPNGTEVWYWPHVNDSILGFTSKQFGDIMQKNLIGSLGSLNRGVKSDELVVLRDTTIPAVLCETGFITNPSEAAKLGSEQYQWQIAWALYNGIYEAFNTYTPRR